jgi:hypothetical protein
MFFKSILYSFKVKSFTKKYYKEKESKWVITIESLLELTNLLDKGLLSYYNPRIGNQIKLNAVHKNVHNLIELLNEANSVLLYGLDMPKKIQKPRNNETVVTIRLDDYLVSMNNQPIKPKELHHVFQQIISDLNTNLSKIKSTSSLNHDYYVRHFTYLMEETFFVLLSLVEVSKHARKQRSRKVAFFSN